MCRERRGVVCFRVKLSGRPLDRARCLTASCRAVVAALQRRDGVVTNSRLPCSTAENARLLYMQLLLSTYRLQVPELLGLVRGAGRRMVAGTYSAAEFGGPALSPWA